MAEAVVETLKPLQERYYQLTEDAGYLDNILAEGAAKARAMADKTLQQVKDAMGFLPASNPEQIAQ